MVSVIYPIPPQKENTQVFFNYCSNIPTVLVVQIGLQKDDFLALKPQKGKEAKRVAECTDRKQSME